MLDKVLDVSVELVAVAIVAATALALLRVI